MRVPFVRIRQKDAEKEIERLKESGEFLGDYKIRSEENWLLVPVKHSTETGDFVENPRIRMDHVGSFERVADFFVIKERDGWQEILEEIQRKQSPRAIFLDSGVEGAFRIRKLRRVYGTGNSAGIHKENGLRYNVDLERAYFSPRLAALRKEITDSCVKSSKSGLIVDMYAGVGPISIPLLKRNANVLSIDVNPAAVKLMVQNMRLNKVKGNAIIADSNRIYDCLGEVEQVIMNHPTQSLSVVQEIIGKLEKNTIIHVTYIAKRSESVGFDRVEIIKRKTVHGYSPSSSLYYFMLEKK